MISRYIAVYNFMTWGDSSDRLTPNELYVYAALNTLKSYLTDTARTSIDMLSQMVRVSSSETRNKASLRRLVLSLQEKGVVTIQGNPAKNSSLLTVGFVRFNQGFEKIGVSLFDRAETAEDFYVLCIVARWSNGLKCTVPFSQWAKVLGCSESTAKRLIPDMIERGLLIMKSGKRTKDGRQENNTYWIASQQTMSKAGDIGQTEDSVTLATSEPDAVLEASLDDVQIPPAIEDILSSVHDVCLDTETPVDVTLNALDDGQDVTVLEDASDAMDAANVQPEDVFTNPYVFAKYFTIDHDVDIDVQMRLAKMKTEMRNWAV